MGDKWETLKLKEVQDSEDGLQVRCFIDDAMKYFDNNGIDQDTVMAKGEENKLGDIWNFLKWTENSEWIHKDFEGGWTEVGLIHWYFNDFNGNWDFRYDIGGVLGVWEDFEVDGEMYPRPIDGKNEAKFIVFSANLSLPLSQIHYE